MNRFLLLTLLFANTVYYSQLDAILDCKTFNSSNGPFVEAYIEIYASSIRYNIDKDSVGKCAIEVTQLLKLNDSIVDFQKYILENTEDENSAFYSNLLDVRRFHLLDELSYELEVILIDLGTDNPPQTVKRSITASYNSQAPSISDIQLVESFSETVEENILSKSGMDLSPMVDNFFPPEFEKIAYYFEIYTTPSLFKEGGKFILTHFIENETTGEISGGLSRMKRTTAKSIIPIFNVFDIESLPTGSYNIVVQVRDRDNKVVVEQKNAFSRMNFTISLLAEDLKDVSFSDSFVDEMSDDSLDEFIYCLNPIVSPLENRIIEQQISHYDDSTKRKFIHSFWYNHNPQNPEKSWNDYKKQVILVDNMFGTPVREGYETDRGQIYLKYGPPNTVSDRPNEPSSYPYQLWHYYRIGKFNNKRFVFYQPDLVTNDYVLLHSDLQGQIKNNNWQTVLQKRNTPNGTVDNPGNNNYNSWGSNSNVLFTNP